METEYGAITVETTEKKPLTPAEIEYIKHIASRPDLDDEDADLVLAFIGEANPELLDDVLPKIIVDHPHLSRHVAHFVRRANSPSSRVLGWLSTALSDPRRQTEFMLFWLAAIADDAHEDTAAWTKVFEQLWTHPDSTATTRSKILETQTPHHGLPEKRDAQLRSGESSWLSCSAAVGCLHLKKDARNHRLSHAATSSEVSKLVCECAMNADQV